LVSKGLGRVACMVFVVTMWSSYFDTCVYLAQWGSWLKGFCFVEEEHRTTAAAGRQVRSKGGYGTDLREL
jgi:hypothetical protein